MFRNEVHLKLDETGDESALDLWIRLARYPVGDLMTGTAALLSGGDPLVSGAVSDLSTQTGEPISIRLTSCGPAPPGCLTRICASPPDGQSYLTGYGYGWNPSDLANPPKDPTDPEAYQTGVDGLTFRTAPCSWMDLKVYGLLASEGNSQSYDELLAGGEATFQLPALEIKLMGLYGGEEESSDDSDAYPHAAAAALYLDVAGIGLYGESRPEKPFQAKQPRSRGRGV